MSSRSGEGLIGYIAVSEGSGFVTAKLTTNASTLFSAPPFVRSLKGDGTEELGLAAFPFDDRALSSGLINHESGLGS